MQASGEGKQVNKWVENSFIEKCVRLKEGEKPPTAGGVQWGVGGGGGAREGNDFSS